VVAAGPGVDPGSLPDGAWQQRIAAAMALARVKNLLPGLLTLFTVVGWALYAAMLVEEADATLATTPPSCDEGPLGWLSGFPQDRTGCRGASWVTWLGTALLLGLETRLVVLGRSAARSPEERRKTNVVWDVIAFWPRSVQPFTPWPYSQRVVADLAARVRHHLAAPDRPSVVLAAHSQGSLVSVAALLWLHPTERARMGFVTYGSQLRLQFSRAFPAFVDYGVLTGLWTALGKRWRSLYRDTDPIGGPALSWDHVWDAAGQPSSSTFEHPTGAPDGLSTETGVRTCGPEWRLLDPEPPPGRDLQLGPFATFGKHSGYYDDPAFGRAVEQVVPEEGEPTPIPFPEPVAVGIALAGSWLLGWWTGRARRVSRGRAAPPAGG
jgi:hypothetical protein